MKTLRELAEAATPGPWHAVSSSPFVEPDRVVAREEVVVPADLITPDAAYIAAANPAEILALLDENDRLTAALLHSARTCHVAHHSGPWPTCGNQACVEARAALAAKTP